MIDGGMSMKYLKILLILLLLCGCNGEKETEEEIQPMDPIGTYFSELPDKPGEGDGIFVSANDGLHFEEIWDEFYERVMDEEECDVTIARYTIEGDVIYELLKHEDGVFTLYTDNSRDQFSFIHEITEEKREYLYDLTWLSNEDIGGTVKPFVNRFAYLSNVYLDNAEDAMDLLNLMRDGKENDIVVVFSDMSLQK